MNYRTRTLGLTFNPNIDQNPLNQTQAGGVLAMVRSKNVWVSWRKSRARWEVGFNWEGRKYRFYSWMFQGIRHGFTRKNKVIAEEFANHLRAKMRPNRHGIITFNPSEFTTNWTPSAIFGPFHLQLFSALLTPPPYRRF